MKVVDMLVFVDWNAQIIATRSRSRAEPLPEEVIATVQRRINDEVSQLSDDFRFKVALRLYHGWHKGFEMQPRRKALSAITQERLNEINNWPKQMSFTPLAFSERSLGAVSARTVTAAGIHYPGTLRDQGHQAQKEAMIDTSLVTDLVFAAADREDKSWLAVMGDDVDLVPGLFTAEGLIYETTRRLAFLRHSRKPMKYLCCDGIYCFKERTRNGRDL